MFDMVGDVHGNVVGGCMVILPVVGLPFVMWIAVVVRERRRMLKETKKIDEKSDLEMISSSNPIIVAHLSNSAF